MLAFTATRIYFNAADKKTGFKLCGKKDELVQRIRITGKYDGFIGDYDLLFDRKEGLWYVDSEKKE